MASYFEGFADQLSKLSDSDIIGSEAFELYQTFGFDDCSLVLAHGSANGVHTPMINRTSPKSSRMHVPTRDWEKSIHFFCSVAEHCQQKIVTKNLSSFPNAPPQHQRFLEHATENGARNNIGILVRTVSGLNDNIVYRSLDPGNCAAHVPECWPLQAKLLPDY